MSKFIDLTGQRFGSLTVVKRVGNSDRGQLRWLCCCDCGHEKVVRGDHLREGKNISCGCRKGVDLTGRRFGRLVVLKRVGTKLNQKLWLCKCDCGNTIEAITQHLQNGGTKSCGCLVKQLSSERSKTHGLKILIRNGVKSVETDLYKVWISMRSRCSNKKSKEFLWYGARGITVCEEWNDPEVFIEWAKANNYERGLQIDRIDNNKGYSPYNCRFITCKENIRNRRNTLKLGRWRCLYEVGEAIGVIKDKKSYNMVRNFIKSHGCLSESLSFIGGI